MTRDRDTFDMFQAPDRGRFGDNEQRADRVSGPRVTGSSDLVDLELVLHYDTGKERNGAIRVSTDGDDKRAQWVPHRLCEVAPTGKSAPATDQRGQVGQKPVVLVTMKRSLAQERGLI